MEIPVEKQTKTISMAISGEPIPKSCNFVGLKQGFPIWKISSYPQENTGQ